jgi:hypothetical protein
MHVNLNQVSYEDHLKAKSSIIICMYLDKPWLDLQLHENGTIKKPDELENGMQDPHSQINADILDRVHGSMVGMALGDALGAHVEFRPHEYMVANPVTSLKGGGTWGLEKGQVFSWFDISLIFI